MRNDSKHTTAALVCLLIVGLAGVLHGLVVEAMQWRQIRKVHS